MDKDLDTSIVVLVLLISGFFGFCLGIFAYPIWQDAVEPAQVISGIVKYPHGNPVYIYCIKTWTIIHQMCALFLKIGFSERMLSRILSGIAGMLSYQALALSTLSISLSPLLSIIAPFFIHSTKLYLGGITYATMLMGEPRTYGMIGLSYILLTVALISLGQYKLGGLLLGISPAIHPSLGLWFTIIVFICFIWDFRLLRDILKQAVKFIIIGYSISFISLILYLFTLQAYNVTMNIDQNVAFKYLSAFISHWDGHRHRFRLSLLKPVMLTVFMSLVWSILWKRDLPRNSIFLLRCCVVAALIAGIFSIVYWLPLEKVPLVLVGMMPSRIFNLDFLAYVPLLLGLIWRYRNNFLCQLNFTILVISSYRKESFYLAISILTLVALRMLIIWLFKNNPKNLLKDKTTSDIPKRAALIVFLSIIFSIIVSLILRLKPVVFAAYFSGVVLVFIVWLSKYNPESLFQNQMVLGPLRKMTLAMLCVSLVAVGKVAIFEGRSYRYSLRDRANDGFFDEIAKRQGMILTASDIELIQIRTRRPVLLNGANLDCLPYIPEVGPETNRILQRVYGVDIFYPPEETKFEGGLTKEIGKTLWESRRRADWVFIKRQFGVTDVLTYSNWKLQLPAVIDNGSFVLYNIPE